MSDDRTCLSFLIEAGTLVMMLKADGYALYVTDTVKPDASVPGVPDPALFWYYAREPQDARSHRVAAVSTVWLFVLAASGYSLYWDALVALPPSHQLRCKFPYEVMSAETREFIWPGWPEWPEREVAQ